jgi:hypothetical protein
MRIHLRTRLLFVSLIVLSLLPLTSALPSLLPYPLASPQGSLPLVEVVSGRGWGSTLACLGCLTAGAIIVSSGKGALVAAMLKEGSALALASCIVVCHDAIS